ncbi:hypothetical protein GH714_025497 [Hevea brasiliensis]|uniref:Cell division control protein 24 OB domain-containing protein n=1 Tax=Hevea brasiliensis TaxID=3981 RepID=A0A6A6KJD2_HEVBR|nr:hypothetical protein GH714_025497 [Hevea brasiliensis]
MEIDEQQQPPQEDDPFLAFVDYARSVLSPDDEWEGEGGGYETNDHGTETCAPGWSWIVSRILKTCITYSSGVTTAILLSDLSQDQDDDATLIAAQFCSDSFSSISLDEATTGVSYSLYARIESIESMEVQGVFGNVQRKEITLVDNDGVQLKFLLWESSIGSMLALDRPYIASSKESAVQTTSELCLEYGSATQLYLVPFVQQEQVYVPLTQNRYQGSKMISALNPTQGPKVSQVSLPCDSQGSIDFSDYPFRSFVIDLRDKMTSISLYGIVTDFSVKEIPQNLEVSWFENDAGASFVSLSCLPALLNSSCLQRLSRLSDLSHGSSCTYICRVRLDQVDQCHVSTRYSHVICGHVVNKMPNGVTECSFCHCNCDEVTRTFHLKITLADDSAKIFAWCTGQTATELLQISPDEFYEFPEDEQFMYPSSLENESFIVALVNSKREGCGGHGRTLETDTVSWEITRALRYE